MPPAVPADDGSLREKVRAEQIRTVYLHSPTTTIGSLVAGAFLVWMAWDKVAIGVIASWAAALLLHQAVRVYHYGAYLRANPGPAESVHWGRLYIGAAIIAGLIWGASGIFFYVPDGIVEQTYLALILFGFVSLTIPSISIFAPAFYPLVVLVLTPFIIRCLASGNRHEIALAIPLGIALVIGLMFGRKVSLLVDEAIRRRFENVELIEALSRQKEIAEAARAQAEAANRSKTQFFAAANHDLRQPLHALGLMAAALSERSRDPGVTGLVAGINASVEALEELFNELLDMSKLDAGAVKPELRDFPVSRVLERLRLELAPEAAEKGLRLRADADARVGAQRPGAPRAHPPQPDLERDPLHRARRRARRRPAARDRAHARGVGLGRRYPRVRARPHLRGVLPARESRAVEPQGPRAGAGDHPAALRAARLPRARRLPPWARLGVPLRGAGRLCRRRRRRRLARAPRRRTARSAVGWSW